MWYHTKQDNKRRKFFPLRTKKNTQNLNFLQAFNEKQRPGIKKRDIEKDFIHKARFYLIFKLMFVILFLKLIENLVFIKPFPIFF